MTAPATDIARWLDALRAGKRLEVNCPMCTRRVALVDQGGVDALAIEPHRYTGPVVISVSGELSTLGHPWPRAYLARCPMSSAPITRICDGEHPAPACSDPRCYHGRGDASSRAFPMDEDLP